MTSAQENRAALLASLRAKGVQFRLTPAGMQFRDCQNALGAEERDWIDVVRAGLTQELRREAGLCERCGERKAPRQGSWCVSCNILVGSPIMAAIPTTKTEARRKQVQDKHAFSDLSDSAETDETERMEI